MKRLDSNLFLGNEINEVYKEIMKTMPTDHLDMENVRRSLWLLSANLCCPSVNLSTCIHKKKLYLLGPVRNEGG